MSYRRIKKCKEVIVSIITVELQHRFEIRDNVIANQRLKGLEPDARTVEDLKEVVYGTIDTDEVLKRLHKRIEIGDI